MTNKKTKISWITVALAAVLSLPLMGVAQDFSAIEITTIPVRDNK
jgi:hypothetical protein